MTKLTVHIRRIFTICCSFKTSYTSRCWILICRENAPARSPTSFSYGGGFWNGFSWRMSNKRCTLSRKPACSILLASFRACFALCLFCEGECPSHCYASDQTFVKHSSGGVCKPSRMDSRIPGTERR